MVQDCATHLVRHVVNGPTEEHGLLMPEDWIEQKDQVRVAFQREMEPDEAQAKVDGALCVEAKDGSAQDPGFERRITCTVEGDPAEYSLRYHRGHSPADLKERVKDRRLGK
jgi:hypothetical protein